MKNVKLIFYSAVLAGIIIALTFRQEVFNYFAPRLQSFEKAATDIAMKEIKKNFSAPAPLRMPARPAGTNSVPLTQKGTIAWTNTQRTNNKLPPLAENSQLDSIALLRLEDMFKSQYFAHVSPSGGSAEKTSLAVGYDYLALGENLALGNFLNDKDLVQAWMNSPGHRANILNAHYTEIGVAVRAGAFEGKPAWIGVQIFGRPASDCPKPDAGFKSDIEMMEAQIKEMQMTLAQKKAEIDGSNPRSPDYNSKVDDYNALVAQYNSLVAHVKDVISQYNIQVATLNQCIGN